jgi:hypothetical protein
MKAHGIFWQAAVIFTVLLTHGLSASAQQPSRVALSLSGQELTATGLTPGGQVVWFSVSRDAADYAELIIPMSSLGAADNNGTAVLSLPQMPPSQSIWITVDLTTGSHAVTGSARFSPNQLGGGAFSVQPGSGAAADELQDAGATVEVLWVRPGIGAWTLGLAGDSPRNLAGAGNPVRFALDQMQPVGGSPPAPGTRRSFTLGMAATCASPSSPPAPG